jgi:hypothetical protein
MEDFMLHVLVDVGYTIGFLLLLIFAIALGALIRDEINR